MPEMNTSKLKPLQLRLVTALAKTGKLQHAAEQLGIAQPAASRALAEIEALAGTQLFIRHPKGMTITQQGQTVAQKALVILREMRDLERNLANIKGGTAGKIRVGAVTGPVIKYLVPAINTLKTTAPDLDVTVEVAPSRHLLRELLSGRLDFVLARILSEFDDNNFEVTPVGSEKVTLLVRQTHPLAARSNLELSDVADQEWILQEKDSPIREAVVGAFHRASLTAPDNVVNSSSLLFALGYLAETDAVAAVSSEVAQLLVQDPIAAKFTCLNLRKDIDVTPYFLVCLASHAESPASRSLIQLILSKVL